MKDLTPQVLTGMAGRDAERLARGEDAVPDVLNFIAAMRGEVGPTAAAYYMAALVARVPQATRDQIVGGLAMELWSSDTP